MRRGLMAWDPGELPKEALTLRIDRLRAVMKREGFESFILYTNLVRPSAVSYLTGFTPYWSEGLLLVPREGELLFATALSKRVGNWIRSVAPLMAVANSPRPGTVIGKHLAQDDSRKRVGILELDTLPCGHYDDLVGAAPSVEFVDITRVFAAFRCGVDSFEARQLARADALAFAALREIDTHAPLQAASACALVDGHARLGGAEEAYVAIAPDLAADCRFIRLSRPVPLAKRFAVRASVAYKGSWVRRARTFATDVAEARAVARAEEWFDRVVCSIIPNMPLHAQLSVQIANLSGARLCSWSAESCIASYPLEVVAAARMPEMKAPPEESLLVLSVRLDVDGSPWLGAAPLIVARA